MTALWDILVVALASIAFLATAFLGNWVSEEIRGRLDRLPQGLIRLATRRLAAEVRDDLADEWMAELHAILRHSEGLPVTRLCRGIRYALGLLRTAPGVGEDLSAAPVDSTTTEAEAGRVLTPNTPRVWTVEEDRELTLLWSTMKPIEEIVQRSGRLGRRPGAILGRLRYLGLFPDPPARD